MKFLGDELGLQVADMPAAAAAVGRACGFQRMAMQMIGDLKAPISKKNKARSWEEILEILNCLRTELQIISDQTGCLLVLGGGRKGAAASDCCPNVPSCFDPKPEGI